MRKINFAFGVHLHQPVGNFPGVFEYATKNAYLPFLRAMLSDGEFPFALHVSGPLWEFWEKNNPEIFGLIGDMVFREQCELLGGGFYEPILAVIPRRDAIAQVETMSDYIREKFGVRPRGIWLTERIWEPHLPEILTSARVEYTCVDDYHFKSVGIVGDKLLGDYITEDSGHKIRIFPISEKLRYTIPFARAEDSIEYITKFADRSSRRLLVFADDGEKFGLWPGTDKWVWEEGWMNSFLRAIRENREFIDLWRFDEWIDSFPPIGRVYLPTTSYFEMSEWTLPAELAGEFAEKAHELKDKGELEKWRPFFKGGFWRGFLTKYPESNWMHKRMLLASKKLIESGHRNDEAAKSLYRAQCNCAYWHGVFGGLYLPHLRRAIYDNIIRSEWLSTTENNESCVEIMDIDADGNDEIILRDSHIQLFITPADGGKIAEIDLFRHERNITDTLSRRPEGYHRLVQKASSGNAIEGASIHDIVSAKEEGLCELLNYDWFNRRFLVDHFFGDRLTPENFQSAKFQEIGDFANQPYFVVGRPIKVGDFLSVMLRRDGGIWHGEHRTPITIIKTISLIAGTGSFDVRYEIFNPSDLELSLHFGTETHFSLGSRDHPDVRFRFKNVDKEIPPGAKLEFSDIDRYEFSDKADKFKIKSSFTRGDLWMTPIETVSNSESGFEKIYQQTSLLHHWRISLPPGEKVEIFLNWAVINA